MPLPDPETVIQTAVVEAVQVQPGCVVTVMVPVVSVAGTDRDEGDSVYEHDAACVTVNVALPIVIVPVRLAVVVFAATLYAAVPFPVPVALVVIQDTPLTAVHAQPWAAVTAILPEPADEVKDWPRGEMDVAHVAPAASWLTVNVAPAIVSDPVRLLVVLFWLTLNDTVPLPVPDAPLVTVIQSLLLTAVQSHQSAAFTEVLPTPAAEVNDWLVGVIVGAHGPP